MDVGGCLCDEHLLEVDLELWLGGAIENVVKPQFLTGVDCQEEVWEVGGVLVDPFEVDYLHANDIPLGCHQLRVKDGPNLVDAVL